MTTAVDVGWKVSAAEALSGLTMGVDVIGEVAPSLIGACVVGFGEVTGGDTVATVMGMTVG